MKEIIEKKVLAFIKSNYPDFDNEFELLIKPLGVPNINSSNVSNIVQGVYFLFLNNSLDSCTKLYILITQFAKTFKEKQKQEYLFNAWIGKKIGVPIPNIEAILARDMSNINFRIGQKYNYGYGKVYTLGELSLLLQDAKKKILDVFFEIYLKNDLNIPMQIPNFADKQTDGMPQL